MKRTKIQLRENFTDEERHAIWAKSNGYCAHCGKRIEFGGQATVDHFIPLSQGGVNCDYNIVMLCKKCNLEKNNLIYQPEGYLSFLNENELKKVSDYYHNSYVHSFEFLQKHNILAADVLTYQALPMHAPEPHQQITKGKHKASFIAAYNITLKRLFANKKDNLIQFAEKYLKDHQYKEINPELLIDLYFQNGTIYYMEQPDGIKIAFMIMIGAVDGSRVGLQIMILSKYSNDKYIQLIDFFLQHIVTDFMNEQQICVIPTILYIFSNDPIKKIYHCGNKLYHPVGLCANGLIDGAYYYACLPEFFQKTLEERTKEYARITQLLIPCMPDSTEITNYVTNEMHLPGFAETLCPASFFIRDEKKE